MEDCYGNWLENKILEDMNVIKVKFDLEITSLFYNDTSVSDMRRYIESFLSENEFTILNWNISICEDKKEQKIKIYFGFNKSGLECVMLKVYGRDQVEVCAKETYHRTPNVFFELLSDKLAKEIGLWVADSLSKSFNRAK